MNSYFCFQAVQTEDLINLGTRMHIISTASESFAKVITALLESDKLVAVVTSEENGLEIAALSCQIVVAIPNVINVPLIGLIFPKDSQLSQKFQET